jgi:hypothetical protein
MTLFDKIIILSGFFLGVAGNMPIRSVPIEVAMDHHGMSEQDEEQRHPLEDISSWELHRQRTLQQQQKQQKMFQHHRQLASYVTVSDDDEDEDTPYIIKHKKLKNHIPFAGGDTTHGIMIDAYVNTNHFCCCCCNNLRSPSS